MCFFFFPNTHVATPTATKWYKIHKYLNIAHYQTQQRHLLVQKKNFTQWRVHCPIMYTANPKHETLQQIAWKYIKSIFEIWILCSQKKKKKLNREWVSISNFHAWKKQHPYKKKRCKIFTNSYKNININKLIFSTLLYCPLKPRFPNKWKKTGKPKTQKGFTWGREFAVLHYSYWVQPYPCVL